MPHPPEHTPEHLPTTQTPHIPEDPELIKLQVRRIIAEKAVVVKQAIADAQKRGEPINPLRMMAQLHVDVIASLKVLQIPQEFWPPNFTIGDLAGMAFDQEIDANLLDLADLLGLKPQSSNFSELQKLVAHYLQQAVDQRPLNWPSQYDPLARGDVAGRQAYLKSLQDYDFPEEITAQNTFYCDGGMGGLLRVARTLGNHLRKELANKHERSGVFARAKLLIKMVKILIEVKSPYQALALLTKVTALFPQPGFLMAANAIDDNGLSVNIMNTLEEDGFAPTAEGILASLDDDPSISVIVLTPFSNPTAETMDDQQLLNLLRAAKEKNPNLYYVFDMAYFELVGKEQAKKIMQAIINSGVFANSYFVFSRSKIFAMPGLRAGLVVAGSDELTSLFQTDTIRNFPSPPAMTVAWEMALTHYHADKPEVLEMYRQRLKDRQIALLKKIRQLDKNNQYFDFSGVAEDKIPDVPLYLWLKLKEGVTAWDLAENLGIIAAPGPTFGAPENFVRLSVGFTSLPEIDRL